MLLCHLQARQPELMIFYCKLAQNFPITPWGTHGSLKEGTAYTQEKSKTYDTMSQCSHVLLGLSTGQNDLMNSFLAKVDGCKTSWHI